jgi:hypothetical protein
MTWLRHIRERLREWRGLRGSGCEARITRESYAGFWSARPYYPRQIDPRSIYPLPSVTIKHFNAYDPFAKWTVARPLQPAQTTRSLAGNTPASTPQSYIY